MKPLHLTCAALALSCSITLALPAAAVRQHVIIVGVNHSVDPGVEPLQFADNDAARYAELLQPAAASLSLLTVLDAQSQQRFAQTALLARPPTRAELTRVLRDTFAAIEQDQALGHEVDLVFVYTGHGAVDRFGEGYVSLLDGKLTRSDLFAALVAPSPARFNHLIIDACSAYYLVNRSSEVTRLVRDLLDSNTLRAHPNTGALLATSRDRATHEWTQVEGGVFSHEVLSALAGAADVDGDGALRYAEVGAFVEAANQGIQNHQARVDLFLRPPQIQVSRPLWRRPAQPAVQIALAPDEQGRFAVLDGRGVYVAEFNKNAEQSLHIDLSGVAPFVLRTATQELRTRDNARGVVPLAQLEPIAETVHAKSAIEDALRKGIYTVPFGRSFVEGYRTRLLRDLGEERAASSVEPVVEPARADAGPGWGMLGMGGLGVLGLGTVAASGGVALYSWWQLDQGRMQLTYSEAKEVSARGNVALIVLAAGAGVATASAAGMLLLGVLDSPSESSVDK